MKQLVLIGVILALAGGLVAMGWQFGRAGRTWDRRNGEGVLEKRLGDGEVAVSMLRALDAGDTNAIRRQLQLQIFASLLVVDGLYPYAEPGTQELCKNFIADIEKQRTDGSPSFAGDMGLGKEAEAQLESVLGRVRQEKKP